MMHFSYSYCRENCAVSSVTEPVLSSSLQMSVNKTCLAIVNQPNLEVNSHTDDPAMPGLFGWRAMLAVLTGCPQGYRSHGDHGSASFTWDICYTPAIFIVLLTWTFFIQIVTVISDITGHHVHSFYKCPSKHGSDIHLSQLSFMECICCWSTRRHHNYQHFVQHQTGNFRYKYATKLITRDTDTQ